MKTSTRRTTITSLKRSLNQALGENDALRRENERLRTWIQKFEHRPVVLNEDLAVAMSQSNQAVAQLGETIYHILKDHKKEV